MTVSVFPDVERATVDILTAAIAEHEDDVSVSVGVQSAPHLQVAHDGTPTILSRVAGHATIRVTAWAATTSEAKRLANLAEALLAHHPGAPPVVSYRTLTGPLPARDPDTRAEVTSFTTRCVVRTQPL